MKKYHRVLQEVKEQILRRLKQEGVTVEVAAKDAGIYPTTAGEGLKGAAHDRGVRKIEVPERGALCPPRRAHPQALAGPKKELVKRAWRTKVALARKLLEARSGLLIRIKKAPEGLGAQEPETIEPL